MAESMRGQSSSCKRPDRRLLWLIRPSEEIMRSVSASADISMLKMAADFPDPNAAFSAMLTASVVFPMEGRPAMMIRSPGCSPEVISSSTLNPLGIPVILPSEWYISSMRLTTSGRMLLTVRKPTLPRDPRSAISNTARSAPSTISRASRPSGSSALVTISLPAVMSWRSTERSRTMSA
jgi:hypothetical protein